MKGNWFINSMAIILFVLGAGRSSSDAQEITYSVPLGDNIRTTNFDILGFCGAHLLIYKKTYSDSKIAVYNKEMKILDEVPLDFFPDELTHEDFINLGNRVLLFYQYTHRRDLYCGFITLDANASLVGKPRPIDKTVHPDRVVGNKPYTVLHSADKSKIMVLEILRNEDSLRYRLRTFLYDSSMTLLSVGVVEMPYLEISDRLDKFCLSNQGGLYFTYGHLSELQNDYYQSLTLYYKPPLENKLLEKPIPLEHAAVKTSVLLKIDEPEQLVWLGALATGEKLRDIDGICLFRYTQDSLRPENHEMVPLTDSLKKTMRSRTAGLHQTFDDYQLVDMVFDQKAHSLLIAEQRYMGQDNVRHYDNIALFEISPEGTLSGAGTIPKEQGEDLGPPYVSFLLVNTGHALHFLMNKSHRVFRFLNNAVYLLTDYQYGADHRLKELPVLRDLDNKLRWAPRYGMQVGRDQVIIPCISGSSMVFGKIDYGTAVKGR